jgi:hypothetical protein
MQGCALVMHPTNASGEVTAFASRATALPHAIAVAIHTDGQKWTLAP